ncbi:hypothetical protein [Streptomyces sp. CBMA29]|uniref:hypothetical protein n=1 Tax=Streptomyces sp. CBMA29 TaxID=1896314 RepID=UPI0016619CA6|nr:hypothetical protein [Streptomyces sp. CBMA29]MBD0733988.1 hypothetical protein [Streptomyces sp. CBMA29]
MRTVTVSSAELRSGPWSAERFVPGEVSDEAQQLVAAYRLANRLRDAHGADGTDEEWAALLDPIRAAAEKRTRKGNSRPTSSYSERASIQADTTLFRQHGLVPQSE